MILKRSFFPIAQLKAVALLIAFLGGALKAQSQMPGTLDTSFGTHGGYTPISFEKTTYGHKRMAVQADGGVVLISSTNSGGTASDFAMVRYTGAGKLDSSFGNGGFVVTDFNLGQDYAYDVAIQADGKIVVVGETSYEFGKDVAIARYLTDGSLDETFGTGGKVALDFGRVSDYLNYTGQEGGQAVAIQPDGKILVAGEGVVHPLGRTNFLFVVRYNSDGTLDSTFSGGFIASGKGCRINDMALQPDGKILVIGNYLSPIFFSQLYRLNSNGGLDDTFGDGGSVMIYGSYEYIKHEMHDVEPLPDGKIIVAGNDFGLARFTSSGQLDTSFGNGGTSATSEAGLHTSRSVVVQEDGSVLAAGLRYIDGMSYNNSEFVLVRYGADGDLDNTFGEGGAALTQGIGIDEMAIKDSRLYTIGGASVDNVNVSVLAAYHLSKPVFVSVVKGKDAAEKAGHGSFTIHTTAAPDKDVSIGFKLSGTATKGVDYSTTLVREEIVLKRGQTSVVVPVQVINDGIYEGDETVVLSLIAPPTGLILDPDAAKQTASLTIADDDKMKPVASLHVVGKKHAVEDGVDGAFEIKSTKALAQDVLIIFRLEGSAQEGADYEVMARQVMLKAGHKHVRVPVKVRADNVVEGDEEIVLQLLSASMNGIKIEGPTQQARIKIKDKESHSAEKENKKGHKVATATKVGSRIMLYPNPTEGKAKLVLEEGLQARVTVTDLAGRIISQTTATSTIELDLQAYSAGLYLVRVEQDGKAAVILRLQKQ